MNDLFIGLLSALLATNQPAALSNLVQQQTGLSLPVTDPNDPVEREYKTLLEEDDRALDEIDQWIKESRRQTDAPTDLEKALLNARIQRRLDQLQKEYESFLARHPRHARAYMAFGSFFSDQGKETEAAAQWGKALEIDPDNPAAWNNLANYYGHNGPVSKAFGHYEKAIQLAPQESLYYHNLATTVYVFRKDAMTHYGTNEQGVFAKAMALYHQAIEKDPNNFKLATDVAQTYYGVKPPQTGDAEADRQAAEALADKALETWKYAMKLARDDHERQGILIHYARIQINANRFDQALQNLQAVTNDWYQPTKERLLKKLESKRQEKDGDESEESDESDGSD